MGTPIPQPPGLPFLGNVTDIDAESPLASFIHLAEIYGPIFHLNILGRQVIMIGSQELVNELCDEKRFVKNPSGPLKQVRNGIGDGLFTAFDGEENWGLAHRILMPAFGPMAIKDMFDEMLDISSQLVSKWARYGPENKISVVDDFTRLTLDSIALCAMDTRFNSFYREGLHPFIEAMQFFLSESGARANRPIFATNYLYREKTRKYNESIELMRSVADHVIKERRTHPSDKKDLVNAMLLGRDPKTGRGLPDENVINNMITFLIAGHETTSGLLSFLFYEFLKNPQTYQRARKEVDDVIGRGPIAYEHMSKLPYLTACLQECLRLHSTAPAFTVEPRSKDPKDFPIYVGKERYEVKHGEFFSFLLHCVHRDPAVWGEDAEEFRPERMLNGGFERLPPNSWKPFGNGARACIGRGFAWQEAHIVVALLLQNFEFRAEDPSYQLTIKQTLTIKPKDFFMYAKLRDGIDPITLEQGIWGGRKEVSKKDKKIEEIASTGAPKKSMTILYGSNTGTCEALAQTLAGGASSRGYNPTVKTMDSAAGNIPKDQPVVVITASYEGQPTDNAVYFMEWLQGLEGNQLEGMKYTVFGCGHRDWQATFQKIPTTVDKLFSDRGGKRLAARGYADAADNDIFNDFDKWVDKSFWPAIATEYGVEEADASQDQGLDIEVTAGSRSSDLRQDVSEAIVKDIRVLTAPSEPEKRHIEVQLPSGMEYRAGDYLAVLPINHHKTVKRVMNRFSLPWDTKVIVKPGQNTILPTGREILAFALLSAYVELAQPATAKQAALIAASIPEPSDRKICESISHITISENRISALDLLEMHPTAELPFATYLSMLPPMRSRRYSISSSPLATPTTCSLTYSVIDQPSKSGNKHFYGTATTYLAELNPGDRINVSVRPSHQAFHPPLDIANVPILMVASGSGIAPFRGFVMERAKQLAAGRNLAPALLFFGCRDPEADCPYREEFLEWQKAGAVDIRYAFSRHPEKSEGCKYVQHRLWRDREEVRELWKRGAKLFVCGSKGAGEGVREVVLRTYVEEAEKKGCETAEEDAQRWLEGIRNERFVSDVFG